MGIMIYLKWKYWHCHTNSICTLYLHKLGLDCQCNTQAHIKTIQLLKTNFISSTNINIWNTFYRSRGRLSSPAATQEDSAKRMLWLSCHLLLAISDNNTEEWSPLALASPWPQDSNPVCLRQGSVWSSVSSVGSYLILLMSIQELTLITVLFVWMGHRYPVVIKKQHTIQCQIRPLWIFWEPFQSSSALREKITSCKLISFPFTWNINFKWHNWLTLVII